MDSKFHIAVYWDSSAIVSVLLNDEHGADALMCAERRMTLHLMTSLADAEVMAVLERSLREKPKLSDTFAAAKFSFRNGPWKFIQTNPDRNLISELASKYALKGADLWHLSACATLRREMPELLMLSYDKALISAAKTEGFLYC